MSPDINESVFVGRPSQGVEQQSQSRPGTAMPAEGRKPRSHSARPARRRRSRKRAVSARSACPEVDILSPAAMKNIYYISHNAMDCLEFRGFGWPEARRKKSKRVKKPKSKK